MSDPASGPPAPLDAPHDAARAGHIRAPLRLAAWCTAAGGMAAVLLPLLLLYARGGADVAITLIAGLFLIRCAIERHWSWAARPVFLAGWAWWGWMLICSTPIPALALGPGGWRSFVQALVAIRFFLLAAALGEWLLRVPRWRRAVLASVVAACGWIVLQCWQQYLTGTNLFGVPRWGDGALTGPFTKPRAGPALVLILFPAMLIPIDRLLAPAAERRAATARAPVSRDRRRRLAAMAIVLFGVATVILIGQRMPVLLTGLGLGVCALLLRRLRPAALVACVAGAVLLCALPVVSPPTFNKLVVRFSDQMRRFPQSPYGLIYTRAVVMAAANPLTGLGFDGFRHGCNQPEYQRGLPSLGITAAQAAGPEGCSMHPHNHYMEAVTAGGVPGLVLFCLTGAAWLATLGAGLLRRPSARRAGFFIAVLLAIWPFASSSAFFTLPNAGWLFLMLGAGLAEAWAIRPAADSVGQPGEGAPAHRLALAAG